MDVDEDERELVVDTVLEADAVPVDDNGEILGDVDMVDVGTVPDGVLVGTIGAVEVAEVEEAAAPAATEL